MKEKIDHKTSNRLFVGIERVERQVQQWRPQRLPSRPSSSTKGFVKAGQQNTNNLLTVLVASSWAS
jgi:hypothetical protein